jgi:hypothetical protein
MSNTSVSGTKTVRSSSSKKTLSKSKKSLSSTNSSGLEYRIPSCDEKQQNLRTILFPNHKTVNTQNEENDFLKKQLIDLKRFYETQISRMDEERRLREEEIRLLVLNSKNARMTWLNYELKKSIRLYCNPNLHIV